MKNENEINNETISNLKISLCALLLESSRRYSVLADAIFNFSVEQSHFANMISGQRMALAKVVVQKQMDFVIALEGEALEAYQCTGQIDNALELWEDCLSLDVVIQEIFENGVNIWEPIVRSIQDTAELSEMYIKEVTEGRGEADVWQCMNCGAVIKNEISQMACPICELGKPWQKKLQ